MWALTPPLNKNFLNFFQKPIDKTAIRCYTCIIKRDKTPDKERIYDYEEHHRHHYH